MEKIFRFGIIGWGRIAVRFAAACDMIEGCSVSAVASRSADPEDEYLRTHPDTVLFRDYIDMLDSGMIDGVYIAVPHVLHMRWIEEAVTRNIPVICEKPLVISETEMKRVYALTKKHDTLCMEAFKTKFSKGYDVLISDIPSIGRILEIESVNTLDAKTERPGGYEFKKGGGATFDVGCYNIGFTFDLLKRCGFDYVPENMECELEYEGEVDIRFRCAMDLKGGIRGIMYGSLDENAGRYAVIRGEKGQIEVPYFYRISEYTVKCEDGCRKVSVPYEGSDMTEEIRAFISDVKDGRKEDPVHTLGDTETILKYMLKILSEK